MLSNKDLFFVLSIGLEIAEQTMHCFFAEAGLTCAFLRGLKHLQCDLLHVSILARVTGVDFLPRREHFAFTFDDISDLLLATEYILVLDQESVLELLSLSD